MSQLGKTVCALLATVSLWACSEQADQPAAPSTNQREAAQATAEESRGLMQDAVDAAKAVGGDAVDGVLDEAKGLAGSALDEATTRAEEQAVEVLQGAAGNAVDSGMEAATKTLEEVVADPGEALKNLQ